MPEPKYRYPYFNVVTSSPKGNEANLYLYGYIGQDKWWEDDPTEPLTDMAVALAIDELEQQGCLTLNVRINSPGGSIMDGDAIISALRRTSMKVRGYNDGMCASMAAQIWMAIDERYMAKHAKAMVHCAAGMVFGNAKKMRNEANTLDVFDSTLIENMADATGKSFEEIQSEYFDGNDHWFNAASCKELGLITGSSDYEGQPVPDGVEKMNYRELVRYYSNVTPPKTKRSGGFLENATHNIRSLFGVKPEPATTSAVNAVPQVPAEIQEPTEIQQPMTIDELKNAVNKGEISPEQIGQYLNTLGYNVEKRDPLKELENRIDERFNKILEALENKGAAPGAGATRVAAGSDEGKEVDTYKNYQDEFIAAAEDGSVKFVK